MRPMQRRVIIYSVKSYVPEVQKRPSKETFCKNVLVHADVWGICVGPLVVHAGYDGF